MSKEQYHAKVLSNIILRFLDNNKQDIQKKNKKQFRINKKDIFGENDGTKQVKEAIRLLNDLTTTNYDSEIGAGGLFKMFIGDGVVIKKLKQIAAERILNNEQDLVDITNNQYKDLAKEIYSSLKKKTGGDDVINLNNCYASHIPNYVIEHVKNANPKPKQIYYIKKGETGEDSFFTCFLYYEEKDTKSKHYEIIKNKKDKNFNSINYRLTKDHPTKYLGILKLKDILAESKRRNSGKAESPKALTETSALTPTVLSSEALTTLPPVPGASTEASTLLPSTGASTTSATSALTTVDASTPTAQEASETSALTPPDALTTSPSSPEVSASLSQDLNDELVNILTDYFMTTKENISFDDLKLKENNLGSQKQFTEFNNTLKQALINLGATATSNNGLAITREQLKEFIKITKNSYNQNLFLYNPPINFYREIKIDGINSFSEEKQKNTSLTMKKYISKNKGKIMPYKTLYRALVRYYMRQSLGNSDNYYPILILKLDNTEITNFIRKFLANMLFNGFKLLEEEITKESLKTYKEQSKFKQSKKRTNNNLTEDIENQFNELSSKDTISEEQLQNMFKDTLTNEDKLYFRVIYSKIFINRELIKQFVKEHYIPLAMRIYEHLKIFKDAKAKRNYIEYSDISGNLKKYKNGFFILQEKVPSQTAPIKQTKKKKLKSQAPAANIVSIPTGDIYGKIITKLKEKDIKLLVFDFDETITKVHMNYPKVIPSISIQNMTPKIFNEYLTPTKENENEFYITEFIKKIHESNISNVENPLVFSIASYGAKDTIETTLNKALGEGEDIYKYIVGDFDFISGKEKARKIYPKIKSDQKLLGKNPQIITLMEMYNTKYEIEIKYENVLFIDDSENNINAAINNILETEKKIFTGEKIDKIGQDKTPMHTIQVERTGFDDKKLKQIDKFLELIPNPQSPSSEPISLENEPSISSEPVSPVSEPVSTSPSSELASPVTSPEVPVGTDLDIYNICNVLINALERGYDGVNGDGQVNAEQIFDTANEGLQGIFNKLAEDGHINTDKLKSIFKEIDSEKYDEIKADLSLLINHVKDKENKPLVQAIIDKLKNMYLEDTDSILKYDDIDDGKKPINQNEREWKDKKCDLLALQAGKQLKAEQGGGNIKSKNRRRNARNASNRSMRNRNRRKAFNVSMRNRRNARNVSMRNRRNARNASIRNRRNARNASMRNRRNAGNASMKNAANATMKNRRNRRNNKIKSKQRK